MEQQRKKKNELLEKTLGSQWMMKQMQGDTTIAGTKICADVIIIQREISNRSFAPGITKGPNTRIGGNRLDAFCGLLDFEAREGTKKQTKILKEEEKLSLHVSLLFCFLL